MVINFKFKIRIILPVLILSASLAAGCNITNSSGTKEAFYLDNINGSDRNPGDFRHPLKSISRLNKLIKEVSADIYFAGNQIFDGTLVLNHRSGDREDSILISSFGFGRAIINGGNEEAIIIDSCCFISVNNIKLSGNGRKTGNTKNGLAMKNSAFCSVNNTESYGFQISGVDLYNCRNITVKNVTAHDNGFSGINVMGSKRNLSGNILIKDSRADNNPGDPAILDNHSGNGILAGVSDSVVIDHCTASNNGWDMPRTGNGPVGIWAWECDHVIIQYCISYRNKTSKGGKDGGGFDLDGGMTNSLIQYCLSYENQGAGYGLFQYAGASDWHGNIIRYCISVNDAATTEGAGSFFIWNGSNESSQIIDCYIYNNVAFNLSAPLLSYESSSEHRNFIFSNNIFIGKGQLISGHSGGSRFIGNVWWAEAGPFNLMNFNSLEAWARATGQETLDTRIIGIEVDPLLKKPYITGITDPWKLNTLSGYTLEANSPIRDGGIRVRQFNGIDPATRDFFGNPVPAGNAPEPGICELQ
jgi:parallel beta-helix repeat protein